MTAVFKSISINETDGTFTLSSTGSDIVLDSQVGDPVGARGQFIARKVWNSVWNDIADFQRLNDNLIYGKCYIDDIEGAKIASKRCQLSVIGVASDTFGYAVGKGANIDEVPIAIGGWVLAFVDKEYECGTPLTCNENGDLVEITLEEKRNYPERIVAIYKKKELLEYYGVPEHKVEVKNRHWVKVK